MKGNDLTSGQDAQFGARARKTIMQRRAHVTGRGWGKPTMPKSLPRASGSDVAGLIEQLKLPANYTNPPKPVFEGAKFSSE